MEPYDTWNTDSLRQPKQQQTYEGFEGSPNQIIMQMLDLRRFGKSRQPIRNEVYLIQFLEVY